MKTLRVPKFATEAEEAKWWDQHADIVETNLSAAIRKGTAGRGTIQRVFREALDREQAAAKKTSRRKTV